MDKGTILVVEDEPNIADIVDLYLSRAGFRKGCNPLPDEAQVEFGVEVAGDCYAERGRPSGLHQSAFSRMKNICDVLAKGRRTKSRAANPAARTPKSG